ncbi:MAG: transcription elongation factor GreA-like protein, partial [Candidatus Krumholzibacteriia bacterium]
MTEIESGGPSLIKLGKLANTKEFDKLEELWPEALQNPDYTWRELAPIAGQVGRQAAVDRAEPLMIALVGHVEKKDGAEIALEVVLEAATQLPDGKKLLDLMKRLYTTAYPDFLELPDLLSLILSSDDGLAEAVKTIAIYLQLQEGAFAIENSYLVPGLVTAVNGETGVISFRFDDRRAEFGMEEVRTLRPKPADDFAGMLLYQTEKLRDLARDDSVAFVKTALRSNRDGRIMYKELKGHIVQLMDEKGWKSWWVKAKPALKRD